MNMPSYTNFDKFKPVPWSETEAGDVVYLKGHTIRNNNPIDVVYCPAVVEDPEHFTLKWPKNGKLTDRPDAELMVRK